MNITDKQMARLPKLVQMELQRLQSDLDACHQQLEQVRAGSTDTFVDNRVSPAIHLPNGSEVRFRLTEHDEIAVRIRRDGRAGDRIEVRTGGSAVGGLTVRPQASNVVSIFVDSY